MSSASPCTGMMAVAFEKNDANASWRAEPIFATFLTLLRGAFRTGFNLGIS
jgi:hypothetical protein